MRFPISPRWRLLVAMMVALLHATSSGQAAETPAVNRLLGRGVNLGNALDAPSEGAWGMRLEADYFRRIREAGFQSVRLPVRWSAHATKEAPYTVDAAFFQRVDWALDQAAAQGLAVVLNVHHYEELDADPAAHRDRYLGLWRQISDRYRGRPETVVFELLNEPHGRMTDELWNALLVDALRVVRASNPQRWVMIGPASWNNPSRLPHLKLPDEDRRIVVTFHYYNPFAFTHQGASWVGTNAPPLGRDWKRDTAELATIAQEFEAAAAWGRQHDRPMNVGEFGSYEKAGMESRVRWTRAVREAAEARGMSWAYWEFGAGFGLYDRKAQAWREPLLKALTAP